jgi:putative transcriptional regulator
MSDDIEELSPADFARSISAQVRRRIAAGQIESGADVVAIRRFVGLSETDFASALGVTVETLLEWESGVQRPDGPAVSLLRIAARHPGAVRENVTSAA